MSKNYNLPALSNEGSLGHYLQQIKKFPMLTEKQEINLAKKWRDEGDTSAAHALVTSHLRPRCPNSDGLSRIRTSCYRTYI